MLIFLGICLLILADIVAWASWDEGSSAGLLASIIFGIVPSFILIVAGWNYALTILPSVGGTDYGFVTAVDETIHGLNVVYIRTVPPTQALVINPSEESEKTYCVEDKKIAEDLGQYIGSSTRIKLTYERRDFGLYKRSEKCGSSPIVQIEAVKEDK